MAKYQKKGQIQVLTGFTVVITMPYIEIWNHDIVHLKLIYYVRPQLKNKGLVKFQE